MHDMMCIGRRARACKRLSEAAKTLTTRDHVKGIGGTSTPLNRKYYRMVTEREPSISGSKPGIE
jgi:hypothetical protein